VRGGTASQRSRRFFHDRGGKRPYVSVPKQAALVACRGV
jgi:hypothetical protein